MANTYAVHYNRNAGEIALYDAKAGAAGAYLKPLCGIRGQKEVTAKKANVTCAACRARLGSF